MNDQGEPLQSRASDDYQELAQEFSAYANPPVGRNASSEREGEIQRR